MTQDEADKSPIADFNRRDFLKGASFSSLMLLLGGVPLQAEEKPHQPEVNADISSINVGLIGCGLWGREILQTLPLVLNKHIDGTTAPITIVTAICDNFDIALSRAKKKFAPNAQTYDDYHKLLEQKDVDAVIIATPTHQHRQIVEDALKAGKHVYCEAPIAHTVEDARAIAKAAQAARKCYFQAGLQMRSDPSKHYVLEAVRNGAIGNPVSARAQWHGKGTWRRASPDPEHEKEANWMLDAALTTGLAGELGVHQIDLVNWFFNQLPKAITGFGAILNPDCKDGRTVPDTIQAILQYPSKANLYLDCSLATSFDREYSMFYGSYATVMMRENAQLSETPAKFGPKAWIFQEADSPLIGWEPYAAKERFLREAGIVLSADATKSAPKVKGIEVSPYEDSVLNYALKAFAKNCTEVPRAVTTFLKEYGDDVDDDSFKQHMMDPITMKGFGKAATYQDGYEATVIAIKANEAIVKGAKIELPADLFQI